VQQNEIVQVAQVESSAQRPFDPLIHWVEVHVREELARVVPDGETGAVARMIERLVLRSALEAAANANGADGRVMKDDPLQKPIELLSPRRVLSAEAIAKYGQESPLVGACTSTPAHSMPGA